MTLIVEIAEATMTKPEWNMRALSIFVLIACLPSLARAQPWSGNDMMSMCLPDHSGAGLWYSRGFLDGYSMYDLTASTEKWNGITIFLCIPPQVTPQQVYDMTCKFLKEHPEQRHLPAPVLVDSALRDAFACKGSPHQSQ